MGLHDGNPVYRVVSRDLGAVTAYAAAVNRGYTGTKEEFETLMASYATVAQQAAESAQSAEQSAQSASGSATDAQTAQGTAQQAATDAQTARASAQGYAQSAQQSAQSASQSAQNAESAKETAVDAVDGFAAGAQQALDSVNQAGVNWKSLAQAKALDSEAYALGTRDGEDVGAQDETYHNNAKYYAESAATDATTASDAAQTATTKASEAAQSASAAAESARTLTIDSTLTQNGQAADAKVTGDKLNASISVLEKSSITLSPMVVNASPGGWKLKDDGFCEEDSDYKLVKYVVTAGDVIRIESDHKAQFQNAASVPSSGTSKRVGITYGIGSHFVEVPQGATYLIVSTTIADSAAGAFFISDTAMSIRDSLGYKEVTFDYTNGSTHSSDKDRIYCDVKAGDVFYIGAASPKSQIAGQAFAFYTDGTREEIHMLYTNVGRQKLTANKDILSIGYYIGNTQYETQSVTLFVDFAEYSYREVVDEVPILAKATYNSAVPLLRNGSISNSGNANAVSTRNILPIYHEFDYVTIKLMTDESLADAYAYVYTLFSGASDDMSTTDAYTDATVTKRKVNSDADDRISQTVFKLPASALNGYDHMSVAVFRFKNGVAVPLRVPTDQYSIRVSWGYNGVNSERTINNAEVGKKNDSARHIKGNTGTPLTILHFSDIHSDVAALGRIMQDASAYQNKIDDMICTGDIVGNTATPIESWWNPAVLTCIGNHDSASYSSDTGYNWTALSMADRDAYYIAPFESEWGITHTSGTSYYYKDYADAKIRMIVMDGMLYMASDLSEANTQTAWLENLLADAITNNLHVLIAIHGIHGGATPVECSFTRYDQYTMPTWTDCNTPQAVIDAVASAISNGLNFIGYLAGHTHQDNIWDAEGDGTQFMFCVTCAAVAQTAQWKNADLYRDTNADAFNLVTIDTTNTLVKIVRGGGADIDDHMRTRKAICINYSTGTVVGEVL